MDTQLVIIIALAVGMVLKYATKYWNDMLNWKTHIPTFISALIVMLGLALGIAPTIKLVDYTSMTFLVITCVILGWGAADAAFVGGNQLSKQPQSSSTTPST